MELKVYKRGDTNFNRRFFETQFGGFFRVVPLEADKNLVFVVRTPREEFAAKRITRISSSELHLLLLVGKEKGVAFSKITEVQVKEKDD
jgi:hypothetical protein